MSRNLTIFDVIHYFITNYSGSASLVMKAL